MMYNRIKVLLIKEMRSIYWTKQGLLDLGIVFQRSREEQGLSLRQAVDIVERRLLHIPLYEGIKGTVSYCTLSRIEKGYGEPRFNTLSAIATTKLITCNRGIPLSIYDIMDIASENFSWNSTKVLSRLVEFYLEDQESTLDRMSWESGIDFVDLFTIYQGRRSIDFETDLILLSSILINPRTKIPFGDVDLLTDFCGFNSSLGGTSPFYSLLL